MLMVVVVVALVVMVAVVTVVTNDINKQCYTKIRNCLSQLVDINQKQQTVCYED